MKGCDASGFDNGLNQSGYHYGEAGNRTLQNALFISDWEASSRYDIHFSIKITSLEKCYKEITDWYDGLDRAGIK